MGGRLVSALRLCLDSGHARLMGWSAEGLSALVFSGAPRPRSLVLIGLRAQFRRALARQARRLGFDTWTASSGPTLLGVSREVSPELVVSDLDRAGVDLIAMLRQRLPSAQIAAVTRSARALPVATALQAGASTVLVHPTSLPEILAGLHAAVVERQRLADFRRDVMTHFNVLARR